MNGIVCLIGQFHLHPYVYLRSLEITDATAALRTKERMNMILFASPTILHVPVTYYFDYKRRLIADRTFWYVMISIYFLYTGIPLTIWGPCSVDDLKSCQDFRVRVIHQFRNDPIQADWYFGQI